MKKIDKIIKILKDAEQDFRLKPDFDRRNHLGLCCYIRYHPLLVFVTKETSDWYIKTILKDINYHHYHFNNSLSQADAWYLKKYGYNTERANWCALRLKEIQKEGL